MAGVSRTYGIDRSGRRGGLQALGARFARRRDDLRAARLATHSLSSDVKSSRTVMECRSADLKGSKVRRSTGESICDGRQHHAGIDRG